MRSRWLAAGAALWAAAYGYGYVAFMHAQDDSAVAWWYLGLALFAAAALASYAAGVLPQPAAIVGFVALTLTALLGLLTIGYYLLPAVVAAGVAMAGDRPASTHA